MPVTAWTTYDELTADQRSRYGAAVKARDDFRARAAANQAANARAADALKAAGGDKLAALGALLAPKAPVALKRAA